MDVYHIFYLKRMQKHYITMIVFMAFADKLKLLSIEGVTFGYGDTEREFFFVETGQKKVILKIYTDFCL